MELWVETMVDVYVDAIDSGEVVDLGTNFPDSWQGWLVPTYMIEGDPARGIEATAPDLKSVFDLPQYWELFQDPEDPSKGRFYSCVPGWECEKINETKFAAYGLNDTYNIFPPGSDVALATSMIAAYEKGEPWLGYYWEPTWLLGKVGDMTRLEEPPYDKEIWDTTRACAYPSGAVDIVVHASLLERAPEVVELLRNYETTTAMNNKVLAYMQESEADAAEAAIWFLKEYESVWTTWVPPEVGSKVKAALP
jgi:glycine betaine/proline transport system substrate-binding protein